MSLRTLKVLCAVSILLNIFLIGGAIGGVEWLRARPGAGGGIRAAGADLPKDQRQTFRAALRSARLEMRPTITTERQARQDAASLLRAPTLDQAALGAALARVRAADFAVREHVEQRAVVLAGTFSPADRATLADGMTKRPGRQR